jgi:hypothetical protein
MNFVSSFVTNAKSAIVEEPVERYLDYGSKAAQSAAARGVASGNEGLYSAIAQQSVNLLFCVAGPIRNDCHGPFSAPAPWRLGRRYGVHHLHAHIQIVHVGPGMPNGQRCPRRWESSGVSSRFHRDQWNSAGFLPPPQKKTSSRNSRRSAPPTGRSGGICPARSGARARFDPRHRRPANRGGAARRSCRSRSPTPGVDSHWMPLRRTNQWCPPSERHSR